MWIERLQVEGGETLDKFDLTFERGLNVLIGGRGTGKSSVIELIRYCLGANSLMGGEHLDSTEHALGVLGDGRVKVVLSDGVSRVEVSRTAQDHMPSAADYFMPPLVFSQSEIESIGLEARSRLRLIDEFLPALTPIHDANAAKVRSITTEIRHLLSEIDDISERTLELPSLKARLNEVRERAVAQTALDVEIQRYRQALEELQPALSSARVKSEIIERVSFELASWHQNMEEQFLFLPSMETWPEHEETKDEWSRLRDIEQKASVRLRGALDEYARLLDKLKQLEEVSAQNRISLENKAREIRQQIEEQQRGASALDKEISDLSQKVSVLESLTERIVERQARISSLMALRNQLLDEQGIAREKRTSQREGIASHLNGELGPSIRITVNPYSQHRDYSNVLTAALRGSGLRYADLVSRIVQIYSPREIATLAEARDARAIARELDISEERAYRLCDALRDVEGGKLFTTNVEDDVHLELMDGADFKSVDFLSTGQRCAVTLPVVLQHTDRIIVLDQPEDHLDNAFVVGTLLRSITTRSGSAQTIVATHNPNIPVLGEAPLVAHLHSDGSRCFVLSSGSFEAPTIVAAITSIMEGGREAFQRRAEFYEKNLPNVFG